MAQERVDVGNKGLNDTSQDQDNAIDEAWKKRLKKEQAQREAHTLKELAKMRELYNIYFQASVEQRRLLDVLYEKQGKGYSPSLVLVLQPLGGQLPDEARIEFVRYGNPVPSDIPNIEWVTRISNLPRGSRMRMSRGLGALIRAGIDTYGVFRAASDIDLVRVNDLGAEGIVVLEHVIGRK